MVRKTEKKLMALYFRMAVGGILSAITGGVLLELKLTALGSVFVVLAVFMLLIGIIGVGILSDE